jgi:hypothetical protein
MMRDKTRQKKKGRKWNKGTGSPWTARERPYQQGQEENTASASVYRKELGE